MVRARLSEQGGQSFESYQQNLERLTIRQVKFDNQQTESSEMLWILPGNAVVLWLV